MGKLINIYYSHIYPPLYETIYIVLLEIHVWQSWYMVYIIKNIYVSGFGTLEFRHLLVENIILI